MELRSPKKSNGLLNKRTRRVWVQGFRYVQIIGLQVLNTKL